MSAYILLFNIRFFELVTILLGLYYGFKFFVRMVAPRIVDQAANKVYQDMQSRQEQNRQRGGITIDYAHQKPKKFRRNEGDYIDFEEIEDKR